MQAFTRLSLIYSSSTLGTTGKLSIIYVVAPSLLQHKKKNAHLHPIDSQQQEWFVRGETS